MARRRDLKPEERELWRRIQQTATPMHPGRHATLPQSRTKPKAARTSPAPSATLDLSNFGIGSKPVPANDLKPSLSDELSRRPLAMDAKAHKRLRQGKLVPEGRIDLHGLTLADAHPRLLSFVHTSHAAGKRLVLVITGKGRDRDDGGPIPERRGILRHQVPTWLTGGSLRPLVLQVTEAHRRHGGSGAFYVYLRRK